MGIQWQTYTPRATDSLVCQFDDVPVLEAGYCDTEKFFNYHGYVSILSFFVFGYDWREAIDANQTGRYVVEGEEDAVQRTLDDLIAYANQVSGARSVDIVAHSMGTQVSRAYFN